MNFRTKVFRLAFLPGLPLAESREQQRHEAEACGFFDWVQNSVTIRSEFLVNV